jgi:acyl-CoA thioester hydrolase
MTAIESDIGELDWAVSTEITVNWGDMDSLGHVNHSVFAKWMETTRMRFFSEIGMMDLYESSNIGPILARIEVDYKAPVLFPDVVKCKTLVSRIGRSSFDMRYVIHSSNQKNDIVAVGKVVCVLIDYKSGKPVEIPDRLRRSMLSIEK